MNRVDVTHKRLNVLLLFLTLVETRVGKIKNRKKFEVEKLVRVVLRGENRRAAIRRYYYYYYYIILFSVTGSYIDFSAICQAVFCDRNKPITHRC